MTAAELSRLAELRVVRRLSYAGVGRAMGMTKSQARHACVRAVAFLQGYRAGVEDAKQVTAKEA